MSYSYISGVALQLGIDVVEIFEDASIAINGILVHHQWHAPPHVTVRDGHHYHAGGDNDENLQQQHETMAFALSGFNKDIKRSTKGSKKRIVIYDHDLGDGKMVQVRVNTKMGMIFVDTDGVYEDSEGLLGRYPSAANQDTGLFARDGVTDMSGSWNTWGEEWQVNEEAGDHKLFQDNDRYPQFPVGCVYKAGREQKTSNHLRRRRLSEHTSSEDENVESAAAFLSLEAAQEACAGTRGQKKEYCIADVLVTGDVEIAEDSFYY